MRSGCISHTWAAQAGAHSSQLSTVGAAGTPAGLLTTAYSSVLATRRSCKGRHQIPESKMTAPGLAWCGRGWRAPQLVACGLAPAQSSQQLPQRPLHPASSPASQRNRLPGSAWGAGGRGCRRAAPPQHLLRRAAACGPVTAGRRAGAISRQQLPPSALHLPALRPPPPQTHAVAGALQRLLPPALHLGRLLLAHAGQDGGGECGGHGAGVDGAKPQQQLGGALRGGRQAGRQAGGWARAGAWVAETRLARSLVRAAAGMLAAPSHRHCKRLAVRVLGPTAGQPIAAACLRQLQRLGDQLRQPAVARCQHMLHAGPQRAVTRRRRYRQGLHESWERAVRALHGARWLRRGVHHLCLRPPLPRATAWPPWGAGRLQARSAAL